MPYTRDVKARFAAAEATAELQPPPTIVSEPVPHELTLFA